MTSATPDVTSAAISTRAARLAIVAIVSYQILLIALIFLRPDLAASWHTISEWAIGPHGWIMSVAFLVSALSYAALFVMLKSQLHGIPGRLGLGILLICLISATGVGTFTTDPMPLHPPLSTRGTLHVVFGTSQLVLLPFAALLINLSLARNNETWAHARRILFWTAGLPLFGFLSFAVYSAIFVFPLGPSAYGPGVNIGWPPRLAFFTYMLWVVILGWQATRCSRRASTELQAKDEVIMRKADFTNVDEYISAQPETAQGVLQRVRSTLRKALPGAEEVISYKIPAYRLPGAIVLYFAGWKQHYSLYPAGEHLVAAFKDQLASYKVSKGTIRFPLCDSVPVKLIERIARFRAQETAQREKSKLAALKKR